MTGSANAAQVKLWGFELLSKSNFDSQKLEEYDKFFELFVNNPVLRTF